MTNISADKEFIRDLAEILSENNLTEIEVEGKDARIRVVKENPPINMIAGAAPAAPMAAPVAAPAAAASASVSAEPSAASADPKDHPGCVASPMVGTAYMAPSPEASNFVSVGSQVAEGDTLMIVEAMKVMNNIPSPKSGTVKEILVSNADPVEYGQPLMIIE